MQNENIVSDLVFKQLQHDIDENKSCFDCSDPNPQWASVSNGVFICMNCAALHRALGTHISFVRSLSMDRWSEKHLKLMALGGNKKMKEFMGTYDLLEKAIQQKYSTRAACFYRVQLRSQADNIPCSQEVPSYELGMQDAPMEEIEQEIQIAVDYFAQDNALPPQNQNQEAGYGDILNQGYSMLSSGAARAQENASYYAQAAQTTANDSEAIPNLQNAAYTAKDNIGYVGSSVYSYGSSSAAGVHQSYNDGTLKDKAYEKSQNAASMLSGLKSSLYSQYQNKMYGEEGGQPSQEQNQPAINLEQKPSKDTNPDENLMQF